MSDTELFCHHLDRFVGRKPGRQSRFGGGKSKRLDEVARRGGGVGFKINEDHSRLAQAPSFSTIIATMSRQIRNAGTPLRRKRRQFRVD
jgi:hypothetical protein